MTGSGVEIDVTTLIQLFREAGFAAFAAFLLWRVDKRLASLDAHLSGLLEMLTRHVRDEHTGK